MRDGLLDELLEQFSLGATKETGQRSPPCAYVTEGIVKWYNHRKGTGLIELMDSGRIISFAQTSVAAGSHGVPLIGDRVRLIIAINADARRAMVVERIK